MITFLDGTIEDKQPTRVEMNVGGVGYEVLIPLSTYDRLPHSGERVRILTYDHVREDARLLFGFMTDDERSLFLLLLGISGVGPKLALSALSSLSVRDIKAAVVEGDARRLSGISGVGRKTAERIIVELRDKIDAGEALEVVAGGVGTPGDGVLRDAALALTALGYKRDEAFKMVKKAIGDDTPDNVEDVIRRALAR
ncbi:MAG: Holliday junction branch migration protein RuvA [Kiritimatiellae bacterium]|nr:Holliday junction branch migration protein RuvA [Kiritimatiellia bacterium]